jgi:hypothetical protein
LPVEKQNLTTLTVTIKIKRKYLINSKYFNRPKTNANVEFTFLTDVCWNVTNHTAKRRFFYDNFFLKTSNKGTPATGIIEVSVQMFLE